MRLRVSTVLWGLVALAILFGMVRYVLFTYLEFFGPQVSLLSVGARVVIYSETGEPIRVATADAEMLLPAGTKCVVTREPAWDLESSGPGRQIGVVIDGGPHSGLNVKICRDDLREQRSRP